MTFRMQGVLEIDGKQAKVELRAVGKETDNATSSLDRMGKEGQQTGREVKRLKSEAAQLRRELKTLQAAQTGAANNNRTLGTSNQLAAGSMANLTAQGNDVITMLVAGQNPMQLALQQGTQITQVIGPLGAAGAFKALGGAIMSMLSPINLITIGFIAVGAAAAQWLMSAADDGKEFADVLDDLETAMGDFKTATELAGLSTKEMFDKFGTADPVLKQVLADLAAFEKIRAHDAIDATVRALDELSDWTDFAKSDGPFSSWDEQNQVIADARAARDEFERLRSILETSENDAERLKAAIDMREILRPANGDFRSLNEEQQRMFQNLSQIVRELVLMGVQVDQLAETQSAYNANDTEWAERKLASLEQEGELRQAINIFGEDSLIVAELRAAAEREAFEELLNSRDISEELKQRLLDAFDALQAMSTVDIASAISAGVTQAASLAGYLSQAAGNMTVIRSGQSILGSIASGAQSFWGQLMDAANDPVAPNSSKRPQLPSVNADFGVTPVRPGGGGSSRSAEAREAEREREAIERLLETKQRELDILRESDPVKQEMIRLRETLKGATDEERDAVEQLIQKLQQEQDERRSIDEVTQFYGRNLVDVVDAATDSAGDLGDAFEAVADSIRRAAIEALILGTGPLAGIFGGGGSGGLVGLVTSALGFAEGGDPGELGHGIIHGPGTTKSDSIIARVSAGEMIMTGEATQRYRTVLEAMNAGDVIPFAGFARGGMIGATRATSASSAVAGDATLKVELADDFKATLKGEMQGVAVKVTRAGLTAFEREVLPRRLGEKRVG